MGLKLLGVSGTNDKNQNEKLKIFSFLISEGICINYIDKKDKRNALHIFCFSIPRLSSEYILEVIKLLIKGGLYVNERDKYHTILLKYAITITKVAAEDIRSVYQYLLEKGQSICIKIFLGNHV